MPLDEIKHFIISLKQAVRKPSKISSQYDPEKALADLERHLSAVYKSGAYTGTKSLSSEDYIVQMDPYNSAAKIQFEENARAEPMTRSALLKNNDYLWGKGIRTVLDTMYDDFETTEKKSEAVAAIMSKQEYVNAKKVVDKVNRRCNTRHYFKLAAFNAKVYGRSALLKEYIDSPDEHPTSVYPLNSKLMGNVYCNKNNPGKIAYIEYNTSQNDRYNNKIYYEPEDIVYFTNLDYGISPNTLYYGLSEIEPIKDIGETNRVINEEDNKEFARSGWAGNVLLKLPNLHNNTEVENLLQNWEPGKPIAITSDITAEELERPNNLEAVTELNIQNDRRILRALRTPTPKYFEDVTNRACYSEDTETLTENGWKHYWEIDSNEKIATLNPDNEQIEYHKPNGFYLYDYEGPMVHFHSRRQDILVTPEHSMWAMSMLTKKWQKREAKEFLDITQAHFRSTGLYNEGIEQESIELEQTEYSWRYKQNGRPELVQCIKLDTWLEFLGYYLSEGTRTYEDNGIYHVALSQNIVANKHKADKIDNCISKLGFNFGSYIDKENTKRWQCDNKQLHNQLKETGGNHLTKRVPRWVLNLGTRQLRILFDALMLGDGTVDKNGHMSYCTTSVQLADDVQEIVFKLGYTSKLWSYLDKRGNRSKLYRIEISKPKVHTINKHGITQEQYNGKVYCFDVPNHLFVTRRNGKVAIQGNTVQFILHADKETTIEQERLWVKDIIEPQWIYPIWAKELGYEPEVMAELDAKLTLEFIEYNFDTFEQKVSVWLPIYQGGLITAERFLEEIGYPQLAEEYKKNKKEIMKQRIEQSEAMGFGNPAFSKFGQKGVKKDETANFSSGKGDSDLSSGGTDL